MTAMHALAVCADAVLDRSKQTRKHTRPNPITSLLERHLGVLPLSIYLVRDALNMAFGASKVSANRQEFRKRKEK